MTLLPMADGGEGTLDVLLTELKGERFEVEVTGPLGEPVWAPFGVVVVDGVRTGVVEMATASGLALVGRDRRDPAGATTRGTGELIGAAMRAGIERLVVTVGGSATNDGGAGMAQALGFRLLDAGGYELGPGGAELIRLDRIDATSADPGLRHIGVIVATDVDNPLTGPEGASATYGPQKGATDVDVELLDRALQRFADVVRRDLGIDIEDLAGGGAAGGLGAGMVAFCGARLQPGAGVVMDAVGFGSRLRDADLVVTGEGSFDAQSLRGKAPGAVLAAARDAGVPGVVLCGRSSAVPAGLRVASLADRFGLAAALDRPRETLEALAAEVAAEMTGTDIAPDPAGAGPGARPTLGEG
jgi:glycerate kinase